MSESAILGGDGYAETDTLGTDEGLILPSELVHGGVQQLLILELIMMAI